MMVGVCQNLFQLLLFSREKESRLIVWQRRWGGRVEGLRSPREGIGYPLQYSWASLVAQLVKSLPAMWETWVRSRGWEDPLEKGKATHSSIQTRLGLPYFSYLKKQVVVLSLPLRSTGYFCFHIPLHNFFPCSFTSLESLLVVFSFEFPKWLAHTIIIALFNKLQSFLYVSASNLTPTMHIFFFPAPSTRS